MVQENSIFRCQYLGNRLDLPCSENQKKEDNEGKNDRYQVELFLQENDLREVMTLFQFLTHIQDAESGFQS